MQLLGVMGIAAFTLASAILGFRLLRLGARTREVPEIAMGVAFALSGALGFPLLMAGGVLEALGASESTVHRVAGSGLWLLSGGYLALAIGNWRIYRPGSRIAALAVGLLAAALAATCGLHAIAGIDLRGGIGEVALWTSLQLGALVFGWGAIEAFVLHASLRRRQRIGLASAEVTNRVLLWGIAGTASCAMPVHGLVVRLVLGVELQETQRIVTSAIGLVVAVALWLAFFPPRAYRRRFAAAPEGAAGGA